MAARGGTGKHQVGEIHAGYEQNQSYDSGEHVERPCKLGTQATCKAFCGRCNLQTHREKPLPPRSGGLGGSCGEKEFRPEGLELSASLLDSDAVLETTDNRQPKYGTAVESEFIPLSELGVGGDGNSDVGRLAGGHSRKPFSSDADNREGTALDANLFSDNV